MEFDGKNSGTMYQVSLNIEKIFGYHKGELLNQKVNEIMPTVYADFHDRILDNYQQTNKSIMMKVVHRRHKISWMKSARSRRSVTSTDNLWQMSDVAYTLVKE